MTLLQFRPIGDWNKAQVRLAMLPVAIRRSILYGEEKALRKLAKVVKNHIINQDLPSFAKHPKREPNGTDLVLIDSYTYYESITVWQKDWGMHVGVKSNIIEPKSGVQVALLAYWLETGTRNMPARPHWEPSIQEMGGISGINSIVYKTLFSRLQALGLNPSI